MSHQEIPSQILKKIHQGGQPILPYSSKILYEDLLNATDLALVLIFRWATFLPFCHASLTARAPGGTAGERFLYPAWWILEPNHRALKVLSHSQHETQPTWTYLHSTPSEKLTFEESWRALFQLSWIWFRLCLQTQINFRVRVGTQAHMSRVSFML